MEPIVESSEDAVITKTLDGIVMSWNKGAERLFGYAAKEAIGRNIFMLVPRSHHDEESQLLKRLKNGEEIEQFETVRQRKDGHRVQVSLTFSLIRDETGTVVGALETARDITERKRAEEQFRLAVEASPSGMLMVDEAGRILLVNAQIEAQFGYSRRELLGEPVETLLPEAFRVGHRQHREDFFSHPEPRRMGQGRELFGLRKDGGQIAVEIGLNPIQTPSGLRVLASVVDITDRKRAEEQFRLAVEASPSGMLMVDEAGRILLVNAQIEAQFGYSRRELLGEPIETLLPQTLRARHCEHRAGFFAHPTPRRMGEGRDLFGLRKDGKEIPVEIGLNPIQTPQGLRVLASVVDITARKQMEAQLLRTERLAELGTLASGMAHEIGTPMNVILGRAEYLMQRTKEEATKKGLETIVSQVERITKIMNQLLSFARRRPIERRPMDLRQIVEDTLEVVQERLGRHHIKLETDFAEDLPLVYADPDQMSQVLLNLILNAIHAMADEGTLRLGLVRAANLVRLTIGDTGHGIKAEDLAKIFDPFFTTKEVGKGTGLGLTVVHGIIEEHGGTIAVTSEVGRGTTFTVTLPLSA